MEKTLKVQVFDDGQMEVILITPKTLVHHTEYVAAEEQVLFQKTMGCIACEQVHSREKQNNYCCLRCYAFFHHNRSQILVSEICTCVATS